MLYKWRPQFLEYCLYNSEAWLKPETNFRTINKLDTVDPLNRINYTLCLAATCKVISIQVVLCTFAGSFIFHLYSIRSPWVLSKLHDKSNKALYATIWHVDLSDYALVNLTDVVQVKNEIKWKSKVTKTVFSFFKTMENTFEFMSSYFLLQP